MKNSFSIYTTEQTQCLGTAPRIFLFWVSSSSLSQHSLAGIILNQGQFGTHPEGGFVGWYLQSQGPSPLLPDPCLDADRDVDLEMPDLQLAT